MEGRAPAGLMQDGGDACILLDQKRACRRPHEHFDPGGARQPFELRNIIGIFGCAADPESKIAMHPMICARDLVGEGFGVRGQRVGIGHFKHRRDAAKDRGAGPCLEILLMGQARLTKMHLGVDDAGQDNKALCVNDLACAGARKIADFRDFPADNPNVSHPYAIMVDHGGAAQKQIESLRHGPSIAW